MNEKSSPPLALVTGATSGIGEAIVHRLARSSRFRLMLSGRDVEKLMLTERRCVELGALSVETVAADLSAREGRRALTDAMDSLGALDLLVNCAGEGKFGSTQTCRDETWDHLLAVNLTAAFELVRSAAKLMIGRGGTIINIGSDADHVGFTEAAAYCASKGALLMLSRALREELRPQGIRVAVISPGRVDTCFNGKRPGMRPGALLAEEVAEVVEFVAECSPNIELQEIRLDSMSR